METLEHEVGHFEAKNERKSVFFTGWFSKNTVQIPSTRIHQKIKFN